MADGIGRIAFVASNHPDAQDAMRELTALYEHVDPDDADIIVTLGGDGQMLRTLHRFIDRPKPIYGMHKGSVGFLMNEFRAEGLIERLREAHRSVVHPLVMRADDGRDVHVARAINEVHMLRQTYQAAKLTISVDGRVSLEDLIADGILVATPVGSTAYNLSVDGPVLPLGASLLALTPISAFRPRRWRGALLPDRTKIEIEVLEPGTRPVSAVADHTEVRDVRHVSVAMDFSVDLLMLHDPAHSLEERIRREQFGR